MHRILLNILSYTPTPISIFFSFTYIKIIAMCIFTCSLYQPVNSVYYLQSKFASTVSKNTTTLRLFPKTKNTTICFSKNTTNLYEQSVFFIFPMDDNLIFPMHSVNYAHVTAICYMDIFFHYLILTSSLM